MAGHPYWLERAVGRSLPRFPTGILGRVRASSWSGFLRMRRRRCQGWRSSKKMPGRW